MILSYKNIIKEDHVNLRKPSVDVSFPLTDEDLQTIYDMNDYLINGYDEEKCELYGIRPGVGISAVQINVLKKIFIILGYDEYGELHHYVVINPKIISHSEELTYLEGGEGCLSVDREVAGFIHRPKRITAQVTLLNLETKELTKTTMRLKGYMAIVFQHEYDHLFGKLFIDYINKNNPFFIPSNSTPVVFPKDEETVSN